MRAEEMALLLLAIVFLVLLGGKFMLSAQNPAPAAPVNADGPWHYDHRSPYYGILPPEVRRFRSDAPHEVADRVCRSMGGTLHFLRTSASKGLHKKGFNCLFHEPDMTISADFGDLSRIPARLE